MCQSIWQPMDLRSTFALPTWPHVTELTTGLDPHCFLAESPADRIARFNTVLRIHQVIPWLRILPTCLHACVVAAHTCPLPHTELFVPHSSCPNPANGEENANEYTLELYEHCQILCSPHEQIVFVPMPGASLANNKLLVRDLHWYSCKANNSSLTGTFIL